MKRRVVVTGMGAITPVGNDVATTWQSLIEGKSGTAPITKFDASKFPVRFAAEVKGFNPLDFKQSGRTSTPSTRSPPRDRR
jgi:3-oxoacyl-[acyl-carrier-protein] synthase II